MTNDVELVPVPVSWSGDVAVATIERSSAIERLPGFPEQDPTSVSRSPSSSPTPVTPLGPTCQTLKVWDAWCAGVGVHPAGSERNRRAGLPVRSRCRQAPVATRTSPGNGPSTGTVTRPGRAGNGPSSPHPLASACTTGTPSPPREVGANKVSY